MTTPCERSWLVRSDAHHVALMERIGIEGIATFERGSTAHLACGGQTPRPGGVRETSQRTRRGGRRRVRYGK